MQLEKRVWFVGSRQLHGFARQGEGTPLILLHGAGGNAMWWVPLAERLPDCPLVLLDLPGHGESDPPDRWELSAIARDLAAIARDTLREPTVWVGHSWGGKLAALVAAEHPGLVRGLALVDPSPAQEIAVLVEQVVANFGDELGPWPTLAAGVAAVSHLPQYNPLTAQLQAAFERGLRFATDGSCRARLQKSELIALCTALFGVDCSSQFRDIRCPILVLVASQSRQWQEQTNRIAFPDADWVEIDGHHWLHTDRAGQVADHLREWISRIA